MQDSSACIQLSKPCPYFSCPQGKTGHLFISGAHEVGIRIKIRSLNMCINESCCKINGCATSGGEDAK